MERDFTVTSSKVILACSLLARLLADDPAHAASPPMAATSTLSDKKPAICAGSTGQVYCREYSHGFIPSTIGGLGERR